MKGDAKLIEYLNGCLKRELTAINQYFLHYKMLEDWDIKKLAKKEKQEAFEEMKHAEMLIERILFLEGLPNLQELGKLRIGQNVKEILECDLELEREYHPYLKEVVAYCENIQDYVSREIVVGLLEEVENQIDFLEAQLELIDKIGIQNFIQSWL